MYISDYIGQKGLEFNQICGHFPIAKLYAFGSATTNAFDQQNSDIDLVIELYTLDPVQRGEALIQIWDKLESFFQRKVDLITLSSLKNPILKRSIEESKVLIYEKA
jgi:predicted nucleotidyltransferase